MSTIDLEILWFCLVAFLFVGYFFLEGFDFGIGMLIHPIGGRDDAKRSAVVRTIGPVWDANEVWLITAAGALFAAFPSWYATLFSGFYLPLFGILICLILRVLALEWRSKVDAKRWRTVLDRFTAAASWAVPALWALIFANMVRGLPVEEDQVLRGTPSMIAGLFNGYALLAVIAFLALFLLHGLAFLRLKTLGTVRDRAEKFAAPVGIAAAASGLPFLVWTQLSYGKEWTWLLVSLGGIGIALAVGAMIAHRDGIAFIATGMAVISAVTLLFASLFPALMPSSIDGVTGLTIRNSASSDYTLSILTWAAIIATPMVIAYQAWVYRVFSKRITAEPGESVTPPVPRWRRKVRG